MSEFVRVGSLREFPEGKGRRVTVDGTDVGVFKIEGEIYAITDACPHMGASLADGKLEGKRVVCHWHGWQFDLSSGRTEEREWACANVYTVKLDGDDVLLKPPPPPPPAADDDEPWVVFDPDKHLKKK